MNRTVSMLILAAAGCLATGCTTGYWIDRARDAADVLTVSCSKGGGVKLRVGPVHVGLVLATGSYGLRSGQLGAMAGRWNMDLELLVIPVHDGDQFRFSVEGVDDGLNRGKQYAAFGLLPFVTTGFEGNIDGRGNPAYFTQIEVVAGLGLVFRLGCNPGEFLDFVLGWFGVDILGDDFGGGPRYQGPRQIHRREETKPTLPLGPKAAPGDAEKVQFLEETIRSLETEAE